MTHGSLFSGIGGFDLASEWMGWENIFHCEWMPFPRKVLDYYWPNADSHIDICKTDFTKYANKIDILTGGFPCQPFSLAGKRKGTDDERYLWGEMLRAIQEIKPKYVIAENVFGITNIDGGLVFEQVCLDLEAQGYEVQPFIIPAAAKNAPHRRDRCWFVAHNPNRRIKGMHQWAEHQNKTISSTNTNCNDGRSTDRKGGCEESKANGEGEQSIHSRIGATSNEGNATNANGDGFNQCNGNDEVNTSQGREYALGDIGESNDNGNTTNTKNIGRKDALENGKLERGRFRFGDKPPTWDSFPSQSPICGGDDGLPTELDGITFSKWRAESIKGYGNAIVPQIAHQLFQIINDL